MNPKFIQSLKALQLNNLVILRHCRSSYEKLLLEQLADGYTRVNMADIKLRVQAKRDAQGFVQVLKLPVYLENLQYAPQLLKPLAQLPAGSVLASCMQSVMLAKEAQALENVCFLHLPLTVSDKKSAQNPLEKQRNYDEYLRDVLQADVVEVTKVSDGFKFYDFLVGAATMLGLEVNYTRLARAAQITSATAKMWLKVLEGTGLVYLPRVSVGDHEKAVVKLYFRDTALACELLVQNYGAVGAQQENILRNDALNVERERYINAGVYPLPDLYKI